MRTVLTRFRLARHSALDELEERPPTAAATCFAR